ncbi:MAG: RluA family pseudouridine synthase, partial [Clostridia bacterium]|nr:RluA family pseudouridine synthase [Clostridia bacterium]
MEKIVIEAVNPQNFRIDKYISEEIEDISRSFASKLLEEEKVTVSGKPASKNYRPKDGEVIEISLPEPKKLSLMPENIPIDIVYEDDSLAVINKPQGMVVHPANGNESGTLVNALLYHFGDNLSAINGVIRPGIVHRIDKDTAGLLVVAKTNEAHLALSRQLKEKKAKRRYLAIVHGNINDGGTVDKPIGRHPKDRKKMAVVAGGRNAVTHYNVLENFRDSALLECILETGRTHQIRVHMASIGHSIVGDKTYTTIREKIKTAGQLLFAETIGFDHPKTNEYMEFKAELPDYFSEILTYV